MNIKQSLLPEVDMEMAKPRKKPGRVPDTKFSFQPHPKSPETGGMPKHLAQQVSWSTMTLKTDSLDIAPPEGTAYKPETASNTKRLLEIFDQNLAEARAVLESATNEQLMQNWTLLKGGQAVMTMPKVVVLRSFV